MKLSKGDRVIIMKRACDHDDTAKMFEYYTTYKEIREKADLMIKSNYIGYDFMKDIYFIWKQGRVDSVKLSANGCMYTQYWNSIRQRNQFYNILSTLEIKLSMRGKWNGQTKAEFEKNYKRVKDIVEKSNGDVDKAVVLSKTQANRITDEWKAINRAMAAKQVQNLDEVHEVIFETFFHRAYELGSVSKQEYREYKLEKLGIC